MNYMNILLREGFKNTKLQTLSEWGGVQEIPPIVDF